MVSAWHSLSPHFRRWRRRAVPAPPPRSPRPQWYSGRFLTVRHNVARSHSSWPRDTGVQSPDCASCNRLRPPHFPPDWPPEFGPAMARTLTRGGKRVRTAACGCCAAFCFFRECMTAVEDLNLVEDQLGGHGGSHTTSAYYL